MLPKREYTFNRSKASLVYLARITKIKGVGGLALQWLWLHGKALSLRSWLLLGRLQAASHEQSTETARHQPMTSVFHLKTSPFRESIFSPSQRTHDWEVGVGTYLIGEPQQGQSRTSDLSEQGRQRREKTRNNGLGCKD